MAQIGSEEPETSVASATELILFDGVCNLCNATVRWVIQRDPHGRFRFGALQSNAAKRALAATSLAAGPGALPDSIVLVDSEGAHTRSTAAIRIARRMGFPYVLLSVGLILPRPIRDAIYNLVARNRYRWFGRRDQCMVPTAELESRFMDAD